MGKWFSKFYDPLMAPCEKGKFLAIRRGLLDEAKGEVLEVGSGTGVNFPLYNSEQVSHVIAIEPSLDMQKRSMRRLERAQVPINLKEASAEHLPFKDEAFDTVVYTLVLCSVDCPAAALQEAKRVLKPGGQLLFFEHVRMEKKSLGWLQDKLTPVWKRMCDGCHLNRKTLETIKSTGFKIIKMRSDYNGLFLSGVAKNENEEEIKVQVF